MTMPCAPVEGYVVYDRAPNGARAPVGRAPTREAAVALAQAEASASRGLLLVCRTRTLGRVRAVRVLDAVAPDGRVAPATSPLPAPVGPRPRPPLGPGSGWTPPVPPLPTLAVQELRAFVTDAGAGAYADRELLRSALQRHLQGDDDLVEELFSHLPD